MTLDELLAGTTAPFLSIDEVHELGLFPGVGRAGLYAAARRGELPVLRLGRRMLVPAETLRQLAGATSGATAPEVLGAAS